MKIEVAFNADVSAMSDQELEAAIWTLRRVRLERQIEAKFPYPPLPWIAMLNAIDGDCDLEDDHDDEDGADREHENEHGTELDEGEGDGDNLEPNLGWPEDCSQFEDMAALGQIDMAADDPNDTDALPLAGEPLDFDRSGYREARELIRRAQCKAGYWARRNALRVRS